MNARPMIIALALSFSVLNAAAGDLAPAQASAQATGEGAMLRETDSAAIAMLRANFSGHCRQNAECTKAASTPERAAADALAAAKTAPSTPERRRAIGLTEPSYTP